MKKLITAALAALAMLAVTPASAHHVTEHNDHSSGYKYYKVKNAIVCLRIDTGVPVETDAVYGDNRAAMSIWYHNADGNWQHWLNDSTKNTLHRSNRWSDRNTYACLEKFPEAWVRDGHEALHAYAGNSKSDNRNNGFGHKDSRPYKVNMVNHFWQNNARYWCFVAGYNKKWNSSANRTEARWWLHLKKISGQGC